MADSYLEFDGSSGYITVPNNAALNFGLGQFSISFWARFNELDCSVLSKGAFPLDAGYTIIFQGPTEETDSYISMILSNPGSYSEYRVTLGKIESLGWTHFAFMRDDDFGARAFINGVQRFCSGGISYGDGQSDVSDDLIIGKWDYLYGAIDDLRIYKGKSLLPEEVLKIYNGGRGKKYEASDVTGATSVVAFDFDEGTGNPQSKGTVLTGTISGGVTWKDGGTPLDIGTGMIADMLYQMWGW